MSNTRIAALPVAALTVSACGQSDAPTDRPAVAQGGAEFDQEEIGHRGAGAEESGTQESGKAGHAAPAPDETWVLGLGVLAAEEVLTDLEEIVRWQHRRRRRFTAEPPAGAHRP